MENKGLTLTADGYGTAIAYLKGMITDYKPLSKETTRFWYAELNRYRFTDKDFLAGARNMVGNYATYKPLSALSKFEFSDLVYFVKKARKVRIEKPVEQKALTETVSEEQAMENIRRIKEMTGRIGNSDNSHED